MKKISILGSTGSIGTQTLEVIRNNMDKYQVLVLTCNSNTQLLDKQIHEFSPGMVVVSKEKDAIQLLGKYPNVDFRFGENGLVEAASLIDSDLVVNALVGISGLVPTFAALKSGKDVALANKETLVAGGEIIIKAALDNNAAIIPIDSEHSAIFQCLEGNKREFVKQIIITASGGPFRGSTIERLEKATVKEALNHPKWSMGNKVTIDSATLMNKGLEVIEAKWLFGLKPEQIKVLIHPECIIHSMVEYHDNSIIAQMGNADMKIPISYALEYPNRLKNHSAGFIFNSTIRLSFEEPDYNTFICLGLAYEAMKMGESYPAVLNASNEILVNMFLENRISFLDIQNSIRKILNDHKPTQCNTIEDVMQIHEDTRKKVINICC